MALGAKEAALRAQREAKFARSKSSPAREKRRHLPKAPGIQTSGVTELGTGHPENAGAMERHRPEQLARSQAVKASGFGPDIGSSNLPAPVKRGRPRIEDQNKPKGPKPWEGSGMSRRTWFRRQAERRQKEAK